MARLLLQGDDLVLHLLWWEKAMARRRDVRVPLLGVRRMTAEPSWWRALRGVPERAWRIPGALYLGVWQHPDGRDFLAIRPDAPVVVVDTWSGTPFARLAVSTPAAQRIVRAAGGWTGDGPPEELRRAGTSGGGGGGRGGLRVRVAALCGTVTRPAEPGPPEGRGGAGAGPPCPAGPDTRACFPSAVGAPDVVQGSPPRAEPKRARSHGS